VIADKRDSLILEEHARQREEAEMAALAKIEDKAVEEEAEASAGE
jgi:hypothetical protein